MAEVKDIKVKVILPKEEEDTQLPEVTPWTSVANRPRTLGDLDATAEALLESNNATILTLGDIAYLDSITTTEITDNAITTPKILAGAVIASKIQAGAITTVKLDSEAVTADKIDVEDLFAQTIVATGSITGAVVQTTSSSSGRRVVLDSVTNTLKFIYGGGDAGRMTPFFSASGRGVGIETDTVEAYLYLNEGSVTSISMGIDDGISTASIYIYGGGISIDGDVNFNDNDLVDCGDIFAENRFSDIGTATTQFDNLYIDDIHCDNDVNLADGVLDITEGFVNLANMTGATADARTDDADGSMYYKTDTDTIRVKLNGVWKTITTS